MTVMVVMSMPAPMILTGVMKAAWMSGLATAKATLTILTLGMYYKSMQSSNDLQQRDSAVAPRQQSSIQAMV